MRSVGCSSISRNDVGTPMREAPNCHPVRGLSGQHAPWRCPTQVSKQWSQNADPCSPSTIAHAVAPCAQVAAMLIGDLVSAATNPSLDLGRAVRAL